MAVNDSVHEQKADMGMKNISSDADIAPEEPIPNPFAGERTSSDDASSKSGNDLETRATRTGSTATAVETKSSNTAREPMDKIETAAPNDRDALRKTGEESAPIKKKKTYLHHRHRKQSTNKNKIKKDPEAQTNDELDQGPGPTVWQNIRIMLTKFPYWNMAFWSGWCYSIGSALFVVDGAWSWTPIAFPKTEFSGETKYGVPLLFFFGACLYQVGGVMAYLEAVNDGSFAGAAMKKLLKGHEDVEKDLLDAKLHVFFGHLVPHHHHHDEDDEKTHQEEEVDAEANWRSLTKENTDPSEVYDEAKERVERRGGVDQGPIGKGSVAQYLAWRWYPTWHALKTYHLFEMGYLACTIQLFGVTLYGVTSIVILPGILDSLAWWQELAAYWVPQIVASCCFLTASFMFTIMAQDAWNKPKPGAVSWWIGIHAIIGSVGFL